MSSVENDVTVLFDRDGKPTHVVLSWEQYDRLRRSAGPAALVSGGFHGAPDDLEDADGIAAAQAGAAAKHREAALVAGVSERLGAEITLGIPHEVVTREADGMHPVRAWREYRKLSQTQLAAESGISRAYLAQIEAGERTGTLDVVSRLARKLGCLVEDLIPNSA